jgi:fumarylacetoacetase
VFIRRAGADPIPRVGVAIGDRVLDLRGLVEAGLLTGVAPAVPGTLRTWTLNSHTGTTPEDRSDLRRALSALLGVENASKQRPISPYLAPLGNVEMLVPGDRGTCQCFPIQCSSPIDIAGT